MGSWVRLKYPPGPLPTGCRLHWPPNTRSCPLYLQVDLYWITSARQSPYSAQGSELMHFFVVFYYLYLAGEVGTKCTSILAKPNWRFQSYRKGPNLKRTGVPYFFGKLYPPLTVLRASLNSRVIEYFNEVSYYSPKLPSSSLDLPKVCWGK